MAYSLTNLFIDIFQLCRIIMKEVWSMEYYLRSKAV